MLGESAPSLFDIAARPFLPRARKDRDCPTFLHYHEGEPNALCETRRLVAWSHGVVGARGKLLIFLSDVPAAFGSFENGGCLRPRCWVLKTVSPCVCGEVEACGFRRARTLRVPLDHVAARRAGTNAPGRSAAKPTLSWLGSARTNAFGFVLFKGTTLCSERN